MAAAWPLCFIQCSRHDAMVGSVLWQVILTYGMSDTVLLFLKEASKKREFQVRSETLVGMLCLAFCRRMPLVLCKRPAGMGSRGRESGVPMACFGGSLLEVGTALQLQHPAASHASGADEALPMLSCAASLKRLPAHQSTGGGG